MIDLPAERLAAESGAEIVVRGNEEFAERAVVDSREAGPGDLFFGLSGERTDGGRFASDAISAGAWGVVVEPDHAADLGQGTPGERVGEGRAWVFSSPDPEACLGRMATAWRRAIDCPLVGITGSTGKTSVKDITRALLPRNVHASPENFNTEIGMPLALLAAPRDTEILVMEMAMRGSGQITQLCEIAEPDVAAITNVGPVHLELLGTIEAIAAAKAEILAGLGYRRGGDAAGGRAVVPEDAEALEPHLHDELITFTFGPGGAVFAESVERIDVDGQPGMRAKVGTPHGEAEFTFGFSEDHNLRNALCAIAIGVALDLDPAEMAAGLPGSASRGCAASGSRSTAGSCCSTTATTRTRSRCGPRSSTSPPSPRRAGASRSSAAWPSSGRTRPPSTRRSVSWRGPRGSTR